MSPMTKKQYQFRIPEAVQAATTRASCVRLEMTKMTIDDRHRYAWHFRECVIIHVVGEWTLESFPPMEIAG